MISKKERVNFRWGVVKLFANACNLAEQQATVFSEKIHKKSTFPAGILEYNLKTSCEGHHISDVLVHLYEMNCGIKTWCWSVPYVWLHHQCENCKCMTYSIYKRVCDLLKEKQTPLQEVPHLSDSNDKGSHQGTSQGWQTPKRTARVTPGLSP